MKFKYKGLLDEVSLDALGVVVKRGEVIDVPAAVAGRRGKETGKTLPNGKPERDLGEGLLAQPDVWEHVTDKNKKPDLDVKES